MGDGEQGEGSVMEAANAEDITAWITLPPLLTATGYRSAGIPREIMALDGLEDRWKAYGWCIKQVNGNNIAELTEAFDKLPMEKGRPNLIIANTTKGKRRVLHRKPGRLASQSTGRNTISAGYK